MSDDGYDGGGVGDDYDYGGGYVSLVTHSSWFLYSPPNHEVIKRRHSYVISAICNWYHEALYNSLG